MGTYNGTYTPHAQLHIYRGLRSVMVAVSMDGDEQVYTFETHLYKKLSIQTHVCACIVRYYNTHIGAHECTYTGTHTQYLVLQTK